jgi:hypothetical protein
MHERDHRHQQVKVSGGPRAGAADKSDRPRQCQNRPEQSIAGNPPTRLEKELIHRSRPYRLRLPVKYIAPTTLRLTLSSVDQPTARGEQDALTRRIKQPFKQSPNSHLAGTWCRQVKQQVQQASPINLS